MKRIPLDVQKDKYEEIKAHAERQNESVNGFIKRAIDETIEHDNRKLASAASIEMYPYMTLNDDTEITHSEMKPDGRVKVYIETPVENGFHNATCYLPDYIWEDITGYSEAEINYFKQLLKDNAHLIMEFSQEGGILDASNF